MFDVSRLCQARRLDGNGSTRRTLDTELFSTPNAVQPCRRRAANAKPLRNFCPVIESKAASMPASSGTRGIWGGMTEEERRE